jgi:hypothetical protein
VKSTTVGTCVYVPYPTDCRLMSDMKLLYQFSYLVGHTTFSCFDKTDTNDLKTSDVSQFRYIIMWWTFRIFNLDVPYLNIILNIGLHMKVNKHPTDYLQ